MTVSMQVTKRIYQGNGVTREWDVDFPLIAADNLGVYLTSPQGAEEEIRADYSVDLISSKLTYPTAECGKSPLAEGWKLTVLRRTPLTQEIDLLRQGELDAEVLEEGYDKLTMLVQELGEKVDRSIKYPVSSQEDDLEAENFLKNILAAKEDAVVASSQAAEAARQARAGAASAQETAEAALESIASAVNAGCETLEADGGEIVASAQTCAAEAAGHAETARRYAEGSIGKCMGEVYWSQSKALSDNPGALPLWTGAYYANASALYPDFYAWVKEHTELCTDKADYDVRLETYGECPFYVADEAEGSLRLPKLAHYIKNADESGGVTQARAGLPNIEGTFRTSTYASGVSGAFTKVETKGVNGPAGTGSYFSDYSFDASRTGTDRVYGQSPTVTPAHTTLYPWVCVYHTAVPPGVADTAQLLEAFAGKADADLGNVTDSGKQKITALGKPSSTYIDGIFPAVDTTERSYTAPANGWISIKGNSATGNSIWADVAGVYTLASGAAAANNAYIFVPVKRGQTITVKTDAGALNSFESRFIYDEGEM